VRDEVVAVRQGQGGGNLELSVAPPPTQGVDGVRVQALGPLEDRLPEVLHLVVADQLGPLARLVGQVAVDQGDHLVRVRPAVHEVADLDHVQVRGKSPARGIGAQPHQLVEQRHGMTTDVTDHRVPPVTLARHGSAGHGFAAHGFASHGFGRDHWSAGT
jgi:hypothetical protein